MEKVLITGASGFLGSHTAEYLLKLGYSVRCLVSGPDRKGWLSGEERIEFAYGRLPDAVPPGIFDGVDYVVHIAGVVKCGLARDFYRYNTEATDRLARALLASGASLKKFIFVSSQAAVGPSAEGRPRTEDDLPAPLTDYGKSKLFAEEKLLALGPELKPVILRISTVYGPRSSEILPAVKLVKFRLNPLIGTAAKKLSVIYVTEAVRGIEMAMRNGTPGRKYNLSGSSPESWDSVLEAIRSAMGTKKLLRVYFPPAAVRAAAFCFESLMACTGRTPVFNSQKAKELLCSDWTLDVSRAKNEFDFFSDFDIIKGMRETVAWYRARGWV